MKGISFEWDDNKAAINEAKHHITFSEASTVFADENAILFDDPNHSQEEERFMMLGLSDHAKMLIVCHCYRGMDDVIRIISARKATKNETTQYYKINERWFFVNCSTTVSLILTIGRSYSLPTGLKRSCRFQSLANTEKSRTTAGFQSSFKILRTRLS